MRNKKIEIWLCPVKETMRAELRYTQGWAQFPMAVLTFIKEEEPVQ